MAHVESIYFYGFGKKNKEIGVTIEIRNLGRKRLDIPLPEKLYDIIMAIAQNAADMHELQDKALLLAEHPAPANGGSDAEKKMQT